IAWQRNFRYETTSSRVSAEIWSIVVDRAEGAPRVGHVRGCPQVPQTRPFPASDLGMGVLQGERVYATGRRGRHPGSGPTGTASSDASKRCGAGATQTAWPR